MKNTICRITLLLLLTCGISNTFAESGSRLWLNYEPIKSERLRGEWSDYFGNLFLCELKYKEVIKNELITSAKEMLDTTINFSGIESKCRVVYVKGEGYGVSAKELNALTNEGYMIRNIRSGDNRIIVVQSAADAGLLYATFHLIREMQCGISPQNITISEQPKINLRLLNHWDNLDGSIERGYAGSSIWNWDELPGIGLSGRRYKAYARANASLGINGVVINNVNADPRLLRKDYLQKLAALADIFRKYNITLYLSANFASCLKPSNTPTTWKKWGGIGNLDSADPLDEKVALWWKNKADEIYTYIPDFGGFVVKANCEGMAGPQDYNRTHAEGANMLARALKPHGGIVMWRSFVYNPDVDPDRAKRAYKEFASLDGKFDDNVIVQAKNGPIDFQPAEPVQPLFGALQKTTIMPEFEITQEYTGQANNLVYLLPMWRNFFDFDTYCKGKGSTIAKLCQGELMELKYRAIAGVSNVGSEENWTGHHFSQANWYAFGRLAWNPTTDSDQITDQWILQTWSCDPATASVIKQMMSGSLDAYAAANNPYGIGITVKSGANYGPDFLRRARSEITANKNGIGHDRTTGGSDYVSQYSAANAKIFNNIKTCPKNLLLFFNFLPWSYKMASGLTLKEDLALCFERNIKKTESNMALWKSIKDKIDTQRYYEVMSKLALQKADAEVVYIDAMNFLKVMNQ